MGPHVEPDPNTDTLPLGQAPGQIVAGGIPLNVGTERDDDLVNPALGQALLERVDAQFLRANAVYRGNLAAKHVIVTAKRARLFDIQNIDRPFHHAEHALVLAGLAQMAQGVFSARPPHWPHSTICCRDSTSTPARRLARCS